MDKNDKLLDKKEKDILEDINKKYRLDKEDGEEDIEYESGNSGMIAIIVFVIVCVLIMGFMMLTSENNVTKKIRKLN